MRRTIATATAPGRWRRRRTARIALAGALVLAAPFAGGADDAEDTTAGDLAHAHGGVSGSSGTLSDFSPHRRPADGEALRVVPIPLADPAVADVLSSGDLVDLVAVAAAGAQAANTGTARTDAAGGNAEATPDHDVATGGAPMVVARAARVRDAPPARTGGRSILVEVPESAAPELAAIAAGTPLAVIVHG